MDAPSQPSENQAALGQPVEAQPQQHAQGPDPVPDPVPDPAMAEPLPELEVDSQPPMEILDGNVVVPQGFKYFLYRVGTKLFVDVNVPNDVFQNSYNSPGLVSQLFAPANADLAFLKKLPDWDPKVVEGKYYTRKLAVFCIANVLIQNFCNKVVILSMGFSPFSCDGLKNRHELFDSICKLYKSVQFILSQKQVLESAVFCFFWHTFVPKVVAPGHMKLPACLLRVLQLGRCTIEDRLAVYGDLNSVDLPIQDKASLEKFLQVLRCPSPFKSTFQSNFMHRLVTVNRSALVLVAIPHEPSNPNSCRILIDLYQQNEVANKWTTRRKPCWPYFVFLVPTYAIKKCGSVEVTSLESNPFVRRVQGYTVTSKDFKSFGLHDPVRVNATQLSTSASGRCLLLDQAEPNNELFQSTEPLQDLLEPSEGKHYLDAFVQIMKSYAATTPEDLARKHSQMHVPPVALTQIQSFKAVMYNGFIPQMGKPQLLEEYKSSALLLTQQFYHEAFEKPIGPFKPLEKQESFKKLAAALDKKSLAETQEMVRYTEPLSKNESYSALKDNFQKRLYKTAYNEHFDGLVPSIEVMRQEMSERMILRDGILPEENVTAQVNAMLGVPIYELLESYMVHCFRKGETEGALAKLAVHGSAFPIRNAKCVIGPYIDEELKPLGLKLVGPTPFTKEQIARFFTEPGYSATLLAYWQIDRAMLIVHKEPKQWGFYHYVLAAVVERQGHYVFYDENVVARRLDVEDPYFQRLGQCAGSIELYKPQAVKADGRFKTSRLESFVHANARICTPGMADSTRTLHLKRREELSTAFGQFPLKLPVESVIISDSLLMDCWTPAIINSVVFGPSSLRDRQQGQSGCPASPQDVTRESLVNLARKTQVLYEKVQEREMKNGGAKQPSKTFELLHKGMLADLQEDRENSTHCSNNRDSSSIAPRVESFRDQHQSSEQDKPLGFGDVPPRSAPHQNLAFMNRLSLKQASSKTFVASEQEKAKAATLSKPVKSKLNSLHKAKKGKQKHKIVANYEQDKSKASSLPKAKQGKPQAGAPMAAAAATQDEDVVFTGQCISVDSKDEVVISSDEEQVSQSQGGNVRSGNSNDSSDNEEVPNLFG